MKNVDMLVVSPSSDLNYFLLHIENRVKSNSNNNKRARGEQVLLMIVLFSSIIKGFLKLKT